MLSQFNEIKQSKYHLLMAFLKNVDYEWKEQKKIYKGYHKHQGEKWYQTVIPWIKRTHK